MSLLINSVDHALIILYYLFVVVGDAKYMHQENLLTIEELRLLKTVIPVKHWIVIVVKEEGNERL